MFMEKDTSASNIYAPVVFHGLQAMMLSCKYVEINTRVSGVDLHETRNGASSRQRDA